MPLNPRSAQPANKDLRKSQSHSQSHNHRPRDKAKYQPSISGRPKKSKLPKGSPGSTVPMQRNRRNGRDRDNQYLRQRQRQHQHQHHHCAIPFLPRWLRMDRWEPHLPQPFATSTRVHVHRNATTRARSVRSGLHRTVAATKSTTATVTLKPTILGLGQSMTATARTGTRTRGKSKGAPMHWWQRSRSHSRPLPNQ